MLEYRDVYAGGRLVGSGSGDVITIVNPATEEVAGAVPSMTGADVEVAVSAARAAFDAGPWPQADPAERAAAMDRLAAAIEARGEDTARLVTAEMGMPIQLSRQNNVTVPCGIIRYYAGLAREMTAEEMREAVSFAGRTMVRREPVGVAAVIASWRASPDRYRYTVTSSRRAAFSRSRCRPPLSRSRFGPRGTAMIESYAYGAVWSLWLSTNRVTFGRATCQ